MRVVNRAQGGGTQRPHKSVIQLVRQYQADLEEFGQLALIMRVESSHGADQKKWMAFFILLFDVVLLCAFYVKAQVKSKMKNIKTTEVNENSALAWM